MAEAHYTQGAGPASHMADPEQQSGVSTLINLGGAVMSIGLLVGVGVWGYKLLSRDVTGIPVVRAVEGPMRIQPKDPGGRPADHQGLAVNDVAAQGSAAAPADRLVLAPQPVHLMDEDQPLRAGEAEATEALTAPATAPADPAETQDSVAALVAQLTEGVDPIDTGEAVVTPVVAVVDTPADPEVTDKETAEDTAALAAPDPVEEPVGLQSSLRPRARPGAQPDPVSAPSTEAEIDPASLPAGTRLAQLGAYESAEIARAEWQRISGRFSEYFEGKQPVIQKASSGGRTFYRLRAMGFDDLSDARRFCAVLVAGSADCIPVTTR